MWKLKNDVCNFLDVSPKLAMKKYKVVISYFINDESYRLKWFVKNEFCTSYCLGFTQFLQNCNENVLFPLTWATVHKSWIVYNVLCTMYSLKWFTQFLQNCSKKVVFLLLVIELIDHELYKLKWIVESEEWGFAMFIQFLYERKP